MLPMEIRLRIGPLPLLLVGGPSDKTADPEAPCHSNCGTIKIPTCPKSVDAEHTSKFCIHLFQC